MKCCVVFLALFVAVLMVVKVSANDSKLEKKVALNMLRAKRTVGDEAEEQREESEEEREECDEAGENENETAECEEDEATENEVLEEVEEANES